MHSSFMNESNPDQRAVSKSDQWRDRLAEQERSGLSVKRFCQQQGLTEYSFYAWRKRLRSAGPVHFALVERACSSPKAAGIAVVEAVIAAAGNPSSLRPQCVHRIH